MANFASYQSWFEIHTLHTHVKCRPFLPGGIFYASNFGRMRKYSYLCTVRVIMHKRFWVGGYVAVPPTFLCNIWYYSVTR